MKRMAIISAGFVPVPAVNGGAGEVLTTYLIEGNEKKHQFDIDIYTVSSTKLDKYQYKYANIIQIKVKKIDEIICKAKNLFLKIFKSKYRFFAYNINLIKKLKNDYDYVLIENNMTTYIDVYEFYKKKKMNKLIKFIYHMHNDIDGFSKTEEMCQYIASTSYKILTVSDYLKNHFLEVAPNNKIVTLYNCIDIDKFVNYDKAKYQLYREKYQIKESEMVIGYTGRICEEKGVLEMLRAFKKISLKYNNVKLLIVGSKWYNLVSKDSYYIKLINISKEIEDKVIFTGYIYPDDMPNIYPLIDILVIPSKYEEAFGVVALEGMATKKAIIATRTGGLIEPLNDKCSIIIDKENLENNIYNSIEKLYLDSKLRDNMKKHSFQRLISEKDFDKKNYFNNFCRLIDVGDDVNE